MEVQNK